MPALSPALLVFLVIGTSPWPSSILVVAMRNPVHSALFLLLTFLCVAVLFVMKGAEFVGAVQVLVYAGGIMVLFLFVVMLINVRHLPDEKRALEFLEGRLRRRPGGLHPLRHVVRPGVYHDSGAERQGAAHDVHVSPSQGEAGRRHRRTRKLIRARQSRSATPRRSAMALYTRLSRAVRGGVALPARGHDRRDRHRQARALRDRRREHPRDYMLERVRDRARDQGGDECLKRFRAPRLT